jgi:hypothetical protein
MHRREAQLDLRFDPDDSRNAQAVRSPERVLQQGLLADSGLAP